MDRNLQNQPQTENNQKLDEPKKGLSTVATILIVLLAAVIAAGSVWAYYQYQVLPDLEAKPETALKTPSPTPTPSTTGETTDWLTYTNENQNYKLKHPQTLFIYDNCYDSVSKIRKDYENPKWLVIFEDKNMGNNFPGCESDFSQSFFMIRAFDETINFEDQKQSSTTDIESDVSVAGQKGLKIIQTEPSELDGSYSTVILLNYKNKGYSVSWQNSDAKGTHDSKIDTIVSTFQFIK